MSIQLYDVNHTILTRLVTHWKVTTPRRRDDSV